MIRPFVDTKPHMLIEPFRKRVLFVYRQFADRIVLHPILDQLSPQPFSPLFRRKKQHFQFLPLNPHKRDGKVVLVFSNDQMRNSVQGLGDILFNFFYFAR